MVISYNKLVRDNIPKIIENNGEIPNYRVLEDQEYLVALEKKLDEEVVEYHRDKTPEELLDYVKCMTITQNVDPNVYQFLTDDNLRDINSYI